jgi:hypothetical protein
MATADSCLLPLCCPDRRTRTPHAAHSSTSSPCAVLCGQGHAPEPAARRVTAHPLALPPLHDGQCSPQVERSGSRPNIVVLRHAEDWAGMRLHGLPTAAARRRAGTASGRGYAVSVHREQGVSAAVVLLCCCVRCCCVVGWSTHCTHCTVSVLGSFTRSRLLHRQPGGHHAANHVLHPIVLLVLGGCVGWQAQPVKRSPPGPRGASVPRRCRRGYQPKPGALQPARTAATDSCVLVQLVRRATATGRRWRRRLPPRSMCAKYAWSWWAASCQQPWSQPTRSQPAWRQCVAPRLYL